MHARAVATKVVLAFMRACAGAGSLTGASAPGCTAWVKMLVLFVLAGPAAAEVLVLTDDRALRGDAVVLSADGSLEVQRPDVAETDHRVAKLKLDECLLIRFDPLPRRSRPRTWIVLNDGRRLSGKRVQIGPENVTLELDGDRSAAFTHDEIIGLFLRANRPEAEWPRTDTRVIRANGDVMDVPFAELTEAGVILDIDPSVDPILLPLERVRAVLWPRLEASGEAGGETGQALIDLRTGERYAGVPVVLTRERLELEVEGERRSWPLSEVEAIWLEGCRPKGIDADAITAMTDRGERERPRMHVHRNGFGGPMRVGSRIYAVGIGLRGQTAVEIAVPEEAQWFTAGVGADADAGSFARLTFVMKVDGEVVERITGLAPGAPPRRVAVHVGGKRSLVLEVSADHGSDVGCVGDVVDAMFIVVQE